MTLYLKLFVLSWKVLYEDPVVAFDGKTQTLKTSSGKILKYGSLIISTGCEASRYTTMLMWMSSCICLGSQISSILFMMSSFIKFSTQMSDILRLTSPVPLPTRRPVAPCPRGPASTRPRPLPPPTWGATFASPARQSGTDEVSLMRPCCWRGLLCGLRVGFGKIS